MSITMNCPGTETELGACDRWCGHTACAHAPAVVAELPAPRSTWWQRWQRHRRIKRAQGNLDHAVETHETHIANRYSAAELAHERRVIGALRVALALAHRP
jgi:hypothetical protein